MQDMGDSSLMNCLRTSRGIHIPAKEERDESDLASYAPSLNTHELMGNSAIGLSLHDDDDEDMEKSFCQQDFHDISRTPSFHDQIQQETTIPRLMQMQMEKYGTSYFQRNESGYYTCFFVGCGKKLQANFSRHIAKHEQDGDSVDPNLAQNMKSSSPAGPPMQTCSHPHHMAWWQTAPELPIGEFYNRSYKCKRCYIKQQMDRKKLRNATDKQDGKEIANSSDSAVSNSPGTPPVNDFVPSGEIEEHVERPPKKKKTNYNIKDELILPDGWTTHTTTRKHGKSAGRVVPHWVSPEGKKFRSKSDIKKFLAKCAGIPYLPNGPTQPPILSSGTPNSSFPPLPSSPSLSSSVELSTSILTPLEEDKLFGGMMQHRESISFKPMLSLEDEEPVMSQNSLTGFVNAQFTGMLPHQTEGSCKITGYLEGIGILTQITVGDKTFQGFALNQDLSNLASFSPPNFSADSYREAEKHLKACRGMVVGEIVKGKPEGANLDENSDHAFRNGHRNGVVNGNGNGHSNGIPQNSQLEMQSNIHNHITSFNDQLNTHLNAHIGNINSHLINPHRPLPPFHLPHPSPHSHPHSHSHPHMHHRDDGHDSNSGSDAESDFVGNPKIVDYPNSKSGLDYANFDPLKSGRGVDYSSFDAGDFLAGGGTLLDGNSPGSSDASSIGMDVIADDADLDATHEVPRHAYSAHGTGLLNTHMLISTRHVN